MSDKLAPNAHYRNGLHVPVTQEDYEQGFVVVTLDPYRLARELGVGGGPREQLLKKTMRGCDKGDTERQLAEQCLSACQRWIEMLDEEDAGLSFMRGST